MKTGLSYATRAQLPTDADLFTRLLPHAENIARRFAGKYGLPDPEGAAADAVTKVVVESRYQERWNPGEASIDSYLYTMVQNRLRDAVRSYKRRQSNEGPLPTDEDGNQLDYGSIDDRFALVETMADVGRLRAMVESLPNVSTELFDAITTMPGASNRELAEASGIGAHSVGTRRAALAAAIDRALTAPQRRPGEPVPTAAATKAELKRRGVAIFRQAGIPTPSLAHYLTKPELIEALERLARLEPIGNLLAVAQERKTRHKARG